MSQARWAGPPRAGNLGAQSCEDVSGETGWTTSYAASGTPELRRCLGRNVLRGSLGRNGPDHLERGVSELR
eukprot:4242483-Pyramimonas_sp.AAC.1